MLCVCELVKKVFVLSKTRGVQALSFLCWASRLLFTFLSASSGLYPFFLQNRKDKSHRHRCQPPHHINYIYYPQSPAEIASVKGRGRLGCASSKFQSAARDIALHPPAAAPVLRRAAWRFSAVCFTAGWEGSLALQHTDLERIMTF